MAMSPATVRASSPKRRRRQNRSVEVADKLNQEVGPVADNISKFSSRGLDSVVALTEQGRQALARLDRVLQGVEKNPQQFIFGGQSVPEYAPRR